MEPIPFPQANRILTKPEGMTAEECADLPVYADRVHLVSLWKMTWTERLSAFLFGRVWLRVYYTYTHPPVSLEATRQIFEEK